METKLKEYPAALDFFTALAEAAYAEKVARKLTDKLLPNPKRNVIRYQVGKEQALKAREIAETITGQRCYELHDRYVRSLALELANLGFPICSDSYRGYWWAANEGELVDTIATLRGRALVTLKRCSRLQRYGLPLLTGQLYLPVGAEPTLPRDENEPEDLAIGLPPELYQSLKHWLEQHPDWTADRVFESAIALFLLNQNGNKT
jgi:hypothetical protein